MQLSAGSCTTTANWCCSPTRFPASATNGGRLMIGRRELTAIINTVWDAVETSEAGPILGENEDTGELGVRGISYKTFLRILGEVIPMEVVQGGEVNPNDTPGKATYP